MDTVANGRPLREDGTLDLTEIARSLLEALVNEVMDEQATEIAGEEGVSRNGYRERRLLTQVGEIVLRIPKLREGSYFPDDVVRKWSRTDTALAGAICEMWVQGVSTRKVERVAAELGISEMSRSRVSRLAGSLDEQVEALCRQDLSATSWPYLWLDATYVSCREAGAARSLAVVVAVAASAEGRRRVVGLSVLDVESYASWRGFLLSLRARGLSGVELVTSDDHAGLVRAIREVLLGASWQRCIAHFERNVAERCRTRDLGGAAVAALKAAFAETDPRLVRAGYARAAEVLGAADPAGAALLEEAAPDVLSYLDFPGEHRHWVRTNNVCERLNAEIKRRTRVVQVFPSTESLVRLVGAVCCDQNDAWETATNFIDARSLRDLRRRREEGPAEEAEVRRVLRLVEEAFDRKRSAA